MAGPAGPKEETEVVAGEDGKFEFPSVQPGDWRIQTGADPIHDTVQDEFVVSNGGTSTIVTGHDIEDLEVRLAAPFTLEFTADWGDERPPHGDGQNPQVGLRSLDGQPGPSPPGDESQHFAHVLPGRYRILPPIFSRGSYVASVLLEGREVLGQEVELTPASPPLHIVYKTGLGSLRGTVENGEGATVVLASQASSGLSFIRTLKCGAGGAFDMDGVTPGDYYAAAFDRVELQPAELAGLVGALRPNAVSVRVEEHAAASVELHVIRWPW